MIKINEHKANYLNQESIRLFDLMKPLPNIKPGPMELPGTRGETEVIDLRDKLVDKPMRISYTSITGESLDAIESYKNQTYGFGKEEFKQVKKFLEQIQKEREIKEFISSGFLKDKTLDWFFTKYREKEFDSNFSIWIETKLNSSIHEYRFTYPILYLDIDGQFEVGNCQLHFFEKEKIDKEEQKYIIDNPEKSECNQFTILKKDYLGRALISTDTKAEYAKAAEIAFKECSLSIDTLKIFCITTHVPDYRLSFNIDSRTSANPMCHRLNIKKPDFKNFIFTKYKTANNYLIDKKEWIEFNRKGLKVFHNFLKNRNSINSELSKLLINAIKYYAEAVSESNLHFRITKLFTILESLLLKNQEVAIIESLKTYLSKIVFEKTEDRIDIMKVLSNLYNVRSARIHHAKEIDLEIEDLRKLQASIILLMFKITTMLKKHKTKEEMLKEIDERILKA